MRDISPRTDENWATLLANLNPGKVSGSTSLSERSIMKETMRSGDWMTSISACSVFIPPLGRCEARFRFMHIFRYKFLYFIFAGHRFHVDLHQRNFFLPLHPPLAATARTRFLPSFFFFAASRCPSLFSRHRPLLAAWFCSVSSSDTNTKANEPPTVSL